MISKLTIDKIITLIFDYIFISNSLNNISNEFDIKSGFAFKSTDYIEDFEKGILNFRVTNINFDGTTDLSNNKYINNNLLNQYEDYLLNEGDVLLVMVGGSLGKVGFIDSKVLPALMNQNLWRFIPKEKDNYDSKYVFYLIKYLVLNKLETRNSGHGHISKEVFKKNNIPIIAKDLQIIISKYIDDLNNGIINDFFIENLDFEIKKIINNDININNLFALNNKNLSYIKQLKQAILQEAIEGKLTSSWRENNPNIESASILLEKIQKEKEELVKQKKLKLGKKQSSNELKDFLLEIPEGWFYPDLDDITKSITDGTHQTPNYTEKGRIFLSAQNIKPFKFMPEKHKFVSEKDYQNYISTSFAEKGDLLLGRVGAGIGETAVVDKDLEFAIYVSLGLVKTFKEYTDSNYLAIVFNSPYGIKYSKGNVSSAGGSAGNFNLGKIRSFPIPFPSLEEQKEIVKKVDEMMKLCDELEKQTLETKKNSENLMKSVLSEVFSR